MKPSLKLLMSAIEAADIPGECAELLAAMVRELDNMDRAIKVGLGISEKPEALKAMKIEDVDETMLRAWADAGYMDTQTYAEEVKRRTTAPAATTPVMMKAGDYIWLTGGVGEEESPGAIFVPDGWHVIHSIRPDGGISVCGHERVTIGRWRIAAWSRQGKR
jgi:hypothetical protein